MHDHTHHACGQQPLHHLHFALGSLPALLRRDGLSASSNEWCQWSDKAIPGVWKLVYDFLVEGKMLSELRLHICCVLDNCYHLGNTICKWKLEVAWSQVCQVLCFQQQHHSRPLITQGHHRLPDAQECHCLAGGSLGWSTNSTSSHWKSQWRWIHSEVYWRSGQPTNGCCSMRLPSRMQSSLWFIMFVFIISSAASTPAWLQMHQGCMGWDSCMYCSGHKANYIMCFNMVCTA